MSETILSQFKSSGIPKTGLTPTITIKQLDGTVVVNGATMVEIDNCWYKYDFADYNKKLTYLIDTDGGNTLSDTDRYQSTTNILDAYPNKKDWKGLGGSTINNNVDTKQLARDVRKAKEGDMQSGTVGEHIFKLDTDEVIEAIDNLKIPSNEKELAELNQKSDNILLGQKQIDGTIKKQGETIGSAVGEIMKTVDGIKEHTNTQSKELSSKIDNVQKDIRDIPKFDYVRVEKYFEDTMPSNIPLQLQIEELKNEIKKGSKNSMKEFILKSIENQQLYERQAEDEELKKEFQNSVMVVNNNIDKLLQKEIDFRPIMKEFEDISAKFDSSVKALNEGMGEGDTAVKEQLEEQYKKSMKYIIYIAKNIGSIGKQDLQEIKKSLSLIKK